MVLPYAIGAITLIILMLARPTAITGQTGLAVASSSARVPGMDGAGGMVGVGTATVADTAIAAVTDTAAGTGIVADTLAGIAAGTQVVGIAVATRVEAELLPVPSAAVAAVADTQAAVMQPAVADSTAAVAAASMVEAADTGKV